MDVESPKNFLHRSFHFDVEDLVEGGEGGGGDPSSGVEPSELGSCITEGGLRVLGCHVTVDFFEGDLGVVGVGGSIAG